MACSARSHAQDPVVALYSLSDTCIENRFQIYHISTQCNKSDALSKPMRVDALYNMLSPVRSLNDIAKHGIRP
jgi:hypothetical protein